MVATSDYDGFGGPSKRSKVGSGLVLIVEDDETLLRVLSAQLRHLGISHDIATSGEKAVELATNHHYRLILMDVRMPGIDGCQAAERIRAVDKDVIIVGVTAEDVSQRCFDSGMNAYYQKPVLVEQLQQIVAKYLPGI